MQRGLLAREEPCGEGERSEEERRPEIPGRVVLLWRQGVVRESAAAAAAAAGFVSMRWQGVCGRDRWWCSACLLSIHMGGAHPASAACLHHSSTLLFFLGLCGRWEGRTSARQGAAAGGEAGALVPPVDNRGQGVVCDATCTSLRLMWRWFVCSVEFASMQPTVERESTLAQAGTSGAHLENLPVKVKQVAAAGVVHGVKARSAPPERHLVVRRWPAHGVRAPQAAERRCRSRTAAKVLWPPPPASQHLTSLPVRGPHLKACASTSLASTAPNALRVQLPPACEVGAKSPRMATARSGRPSDSGSVWYLHTRAPGRGAS